MHSPLSSVNIQPQPALFVVACHAASEQQIIIPVVPEAVVVTRFCPSGAAGEVGWASHHSLAFLVDLETMSAGREALLSNIR